MQFWSFAAKEFEQFFSVCCSWVQFLFLARGCGETFLWQGPAGGGGGGGGVCKVKSSEKIMLQFLSDLYCHRSYTKLRMSNLKESFKKWRNVIIWWYFLYKSHLYFLKRYSANQVIWFSYSLSTIQNIWLPMFYMLTFDSKQSCKIRFNL